MNPMNEMWSLLAAIGVVAFLLFLAPRSYRERVFSIIKDLFSFRSKKDMAR